MKKDPKKEKMTCQVCGRKIMASKGTIANHGYQRPYKAGWQSASCLGAGYVPYEVSCDRLKEVIEIVKKQIITWQKDLAKFIANPPQTLYAWERRSSWGRGENVEYQKPDDFDPNERSYKSSIPRTYECVFDDQKRDLQRGISFAKIDLATMERRLSEWVPPVQEGVNVD